MKEKGKILLFRKALIQEGGAERLIFEAAEWFARFGYETCIVSVKGKEPPELFNGIYTNTSVKSFYVGSYPKNLLSKILISLASIGKLRREIRSFRPDVMLAQGPADAEMLYFASLGLKIPYATFLYSSFFNFPDDGLKYVAPFNRAFEKIMNVTPGHKTFIPFENPVKGFFAGLVLRVRAWINHFVVHRAAYAFSLSNRMAWENEQFYNRDVIYIKSGIDPSLFSYKPKKDMREKYGFPRNSKCSLMLVDLFLVNALNFASVLWQN